MALEQLVILAIMVVFAVIHGLARWKSGLAKSTSPNFPADSEWHPDARVPDAFESTRAEPPKVVVTQAPRSVHQQRKAPRAQEPSPRVPRRPGTPPAAPRAVHAHDSVLPNTGLIPRNQEELRRAIALVAVFGPPRALDPPR